MAKIFISTSALTKANVSDLQTIHAQMVKLTERAENILKNADEVFPAARSSWLRKLKAALGLLGVKDGHTLEDTIDFCSRLVSVSSVVPESEIINLKPGKTILDWAKSCGATLTFQGKPLTFIGKQHTDVAVLIDGKHVGRVVKQLGKPYEFIPASTEIPAPEVYEKLNIAL